MSQDMMIDVGLGPHFSQVAEVHSAATAQVALASRPAVARTSPSALNQARFRKGLSAIRIDFSRRR